MPHDPYQALYIHIPFCKQRCFYCDFTTTACAYGDPAIDAYVDGLIEEMRGLSREGELADIRTVYIGGGTPTFIGNSRLTSLAYFLSLCLPLENVVEYTIEANPESLTEAMVKDLWALGVDRISIGVQSFDNATLEKMGRIHSAGDAENAIRMAKERFENVSIDLMCGIPGQSNDSLIASIEKAVDLDVTHVSMYPLQVEQATPLDRAILEGSFPDPDTDVQAEHMVLAKHALERAGFARYEVANYAKPGFESRHNLSYWSAVPYLGVGKSAVTMTQNEVRRMRKQDGRIIDDLTPVEMCAEDLMLAMRKAAGISDEELGKAAYIIPTAKDVLEELERKGLVVHEAARWKPTERGWLCGNELYGRIWELAE